MHNEHPGNNAAEGLSTGGARPFHYGPAAEGMLGAGTGGGESGTASIASKEVSEIEHVRRNEALLKQHNQELRAKVRELENAIQGNLTALRMRDERVGLVQTENQQLARDLYAERAVNKTLKELLGEALKAAGRD